MYHFFMKHEALSEQGARALIRAIWSHTVLNLSKLFPPLIGYVFLAQYLSVEGVGQAVWTWTLSHYLVVIVVLFAVMFAVARWDFIRLYEPVYGESERSRMAIANRLKQLPLSYFEQRNLSDLSATIMSDVELYETIFSHAVPQFYATCLSTSVIALLMLLHDVQMGLAVLWVIPVAFVLYHLSRKRQKQAFVESINATRGVHDTIQEAVDQIQEIKAYHLEEAQLEILSKQLNRASQRKIKMEWVAMVGIGVATAFLKLGIVTVAVVGAHQLIRGQRDLLGYIAYLLMTASVYQPIESVMGSLSMMTMMRSVVERIKEIKTMPIQEGRKEMVVSHYDIEFQDVSFGYATHQVIQQATFVAKQGEVTALIGPSGSGKTTLVKLAARFWDCDSGRILIGGQDISQIDPETVLQQFAIVFQDVVLFNASIKDNIRIGRQGATDEEVLRAARLARCDVFCERFAQGMETLVGENGARLSGGERQRISIARAILKDAPIVLLDEATASLDVVNETLIQAALSELTKDKTVLVIAHRMRTIQEADQIVVVNNGIIEATGKHHELQQHAPTYRKMLAHATNKGI